jgi:hypothetical protein
MADLEAADIMPEKTSQRAGIFAFGTNDSEANVTLCLTPSRATLEQRKHSPQLPRWISSSLLS